MDINNLIALKCQRCSYEWNYKGNNTYVATCSHCKTTVMIKKNKVKSECTAPQQHIQTTPSISNSLEKGSPQ